MEFTAKELRSRVRDALDCVERGESVTITYRGTPRARLVAIDSDDATMRSGGGDSPAFGMWRDRDDLADVDAHIRNLRAWGRHAD